MLCVSLLLSPWGDNDVLGTPPHLPPPRMASSCRVPALPITTFDPSLEFCSGSRGQTPFSMDRHSWRASMR